MGLKSQLPGSIMPARERSVAILALCSCPLATAPTPPWCHARLGRASPVKPALAGSSATLSSGASYAGPATPWACERYTFLWIKLFYFSFCLYSSIRDSFCLL